MPDLTPRLLALTLTVVDSDTVDPQIVAITSNTVYTQVYDFGSVTVGSTGTYSTSLSGGVVTGASGYYTFVSYSLTVGGPSGADFYSSPYGGTACQDKEGQPCTLTFEFIPTAAGVRYAVLSGNDGSHYLFKGTGYPPVTSFSVSPSGRYMFPAADVGSSRTEDFHIQNTSNFPNSISFGSSLSTGPSNAGDFSIVNSCGALNNQFIPSCYLMVQSTPQATDLRSTVLTLTDYQGQQQTVTIQGTGN